MEHLNTNIVKIVKDSNIGLNLLGETITHRTKGEGVVVGYSSISGEPFAFFYNDQEESNRVCCFGHDENYLDSIEEASFVIMIIEMK